MASIGRIRVAPPLMNSSCAWASDEAQLRELYACPFTGAVTTRTATLNGFAEDPYVHTVAFSEDTITSVNSFGYSPHPLSQYIQWVELTLQESTSTKPIIISITTSSSLELYDMLTRIQELRERLADRDGDLSRIAIELNTSCPNIEHAPPPAYSPDSLLPLLSALAGFHSIDRTLTIGLKLAPFVYSTQYTEVLRVISSHSSEIDGKRISPIAFLTCTNTLGSSLLYAEQTRRDPGVPDQLLYALPTPLGGLAGEAIHALSLGNVYAFTRSLSEHEDTALRSIAIVGVGGVSSPAAARRMRQAGANVVACATYLGREGVGCFEKLSA